MAKFKHGESGNPNGRPVGAGSKLAKPLKEQLADFLNLKIQELPGIWNKLTPRDRAALLKDLLPFFMAKMQAVQMEVDFNNLSEEQVDYIITKLFDKEAK